MNADRERMMADEHIAVSNIALGYQRQVIVLTDELGIAEQAVRDLQAERDEIRALFCRFLQLIEQR